jgi:hypothetical protein
MVRTGFTDPALTIVSLMGREGLERPADHPECADSEHGGKSLGAPEAAG